MSQNEIGDEIAGRIEAMNWFILDLADQLEAQGSIDRAGLLRRLRLRDRQEDQLEYMRRAHSHLGRLADAFESGRPVAGQKPAVSA